MTRKLQTGVMLAMVVIGCGLIACRERPAQGEEPLWSENVKHWSNVPLRVSWNPEVWGAYNRSIHQSVEHFNQIDCRLLIVATPGGFVGTDFVGLTTVGSTAAPDVRIKSSGDLPCLDASLLAEEPAGSSWLCPDGTAEIYVAQPNNASHSYVIVGHELGHVLGLAHDGIASDATAPVSIMTRNAGNHSPWLGTGKRLPALSEKDRAGLRDRYCAGE